jgi:hypothetical protein
LFGREIDVADLVQGMNASIRSPGYSHAKVILIRPKNQCQGSNQLPLDCPKLGLLGPAGEVGAVIGEVHPETRKPAGQTSGLTHNLIS